MLRNVHIRLGGWLTGCSLIPGMICLGHAAERSAEPGFLPSATNIFQFDTLAEQSPHPTLVAHLQGNVRWAAADGRLLVLDDGTGAALVETEPQQPAIAAGQTVVVDGEVSASGNGADIRIGQRLLVDNDGASQQPERSAQVFLEAGKYPLRVAWLAGDNENKLAVNFAGPGLPRRPIPDSALFHQAARTGWAQGLEYRVFEGQWPDLPDFRRQFPAKSGTSSNFDLGILTRDKNVALEYSGYIEIPRDGLYTFTLASSADSQLHLGSPRVTITPPLSRAVELPHRLVLGRVWPSKWKSEWIETDGLVNFASRKGLRSIQLELGNETGGLRAEIDDGAGLQTEQLPGSRVRVRGIARGAFNLDGQLIAGVMWIPGADQLDVLEAAPRPWPPANTNRASSQPPVLTTLGQIVQMKREEAMRNYPVKVRGLVIWSGGSACQICDSSGGAYVDAREIVGTNSFPLRAGEYWEIEGATEMRFSPVIVARHAVRLGLGTWPPPAHPAMDQLLNGSMDAQYVEIQGIVTATRTNRLTLLTAGGDIQVYLVPPLWDGEPSVLGPDNSPQPNWNALSVDALKSYEGALIRIRGSLSPVKNRVTQQFKVGEIQMRAASISVDRIAPKDPFDAPAKRAAELFMFDVQATAFQPVKITGQIVHERAGEYFLMDGNQGVRFVPKKTADVVPGDLVEVAGFPELGGRSPLLREASVRRTGHAPLPPPQRLISDNPLILNNPGYDSTRVKLEARLVNLGIEHDEQVLELQMGSHFLEARLDRKNGMVDSLPAGSLLDLAGVFSAHVGAHGRGIDSFEVLLNSPADIQVLERPSWWTLKRLAGVVGILAGTVVAAAIWIGLLRRQVEQRTAQLRREIQEREQMEHRHAIEAERSRIARDLHDDLGSSLTEISMLASAGAGTPPSLEKAGGRFDLISGKARSLVNSLDVIVWLVNPQKDLLPYLASYLGSYAEEFLSNAGIACRVKIPLDLPNLPLNAETRHGLFLAVKETLNNIVSHANAQEAALELSLAGHELRIAISDNGHGFDPAGMSGGNGIDNIRARLTHLGGRCRIDSGPAKGTLVTLVLPLSTNPPNHD